MSGINLTEIMCDKDVQPAFYFEMAEGHGYIKCGKNTFKIVAHENHLEINCVEGR